MMKQGDEYNYGDHTTVPQRGSACMSALFLGIFGTGLLLIGAVGAALFIGSRTTAITAPVDALVRNLGIAATAEIRPDSVTIIRGINDLAQLQTASFQLEKIVTSSKGQDSPFGLFEDSLIFVAVGEVTAGVDLAKLTENDIRANTFQTVTIRLPASELFIATLDNENSYVADRDTGLLAQADPQMETRVRQVAQSEIEAAALDQDILGVADENAQNVLRGFLQSLGFENVVFVEGNMPPPVPNANPENIKGLIVTPAP